ncbi:hypothetical protein MT996_05685 [Ornithobacterium rhinotracheale]|uniref:hypothetical protein n=1 Tax=Ornithobacterium rhinotracheale TaxID=28251 RepID=UPI00129CEA31|nr:hypothetical protein [Ornithobacterium rhinotracheale]UOH77682.1 hypothetical protein MT996_10805 [Ornithobacterium rhinotracheale]UOH78960.1 hypothetical protein MT996_05685 [Ornithobacterium rhinotracheale]
MKTLINLLIFIIAPVLVLALTPINVAIVFAKDCRKKGFKNAFKGMADYFRESAYRWDVFGCSELRALWNCALKTKQGKEFGKRGLSLSSDLGMQEVNGTMSRTGAVLNALLFLIERNHCRKAYENDELKQKNNI